MSIMCGDIFFHHTSRFFLRLENVIIPNYNKCFKLTLIQKIEEPLNMCVNACLVASLYKYIPFEESTYSLSLISSEVIIFLVHVLFF